MYLIIKKVKFYGVPDSYFVQDQTSDVDIAEDKLRGYKLINTDKQTSYHVIKFREAFILTEEMKIAS